MRFFALLTAGLVALADAYHRPVGDPKGNPIYTPSLDQQVHKGSPFKITWKPTTEGTVTLVLLRGPSTNVKPLKVIAHKIPNNGHHMWTPNKDLEVDDTHYGLQLIVDKTGQYQYSTQFGIAKPKKNGNGKGGEIIGSGSSTGSLTISGPESKSASTYTEVVSSFTTYCPFATTVPVNDNTTYTVTSPTTLTVTDCPCTLTHTGPAPTYPAGNATTSTHSWASYTPPSNSSTSHKTTPPSTSHSASHSVTLTTTSKPPSYTITTGPAGGSTATQPTSAAPTESVPSGASAMYGASLAAGLVGVLAAVIGL